MSGTPPSASAYAAASSSSSPAAAPPRRQPYQYQQHQSQQRSIGGAPSASSSSPPSSAPAFPPLSASSSSTSSSVYANTPPPPAQGQTNSARSSQTGNNALGGGGGLGDARAIAFEHWSAFKSFLVELLRKEPPGSRQNAREKLTRLTKQQFQELSTDVYDELVRRLGPTIEGSEIAGGSGEVPFLPLRPDFHPKRNQARQKLATLPKNRFKDLASDVYFELNRRYPEFSEPEQPEEPQRLFNRPPPSARGAPETPSVYGATSSNLSFHRQNDSGSGIPVNPNNVRSSTASSSNTGGFDFDSRQSFDRPPLSVANSSSPTSMTFPRGQGSARPPAAAQNGSSSYQLQQRSSVASRSLSSSSVPSSQDNNYRPSPPRPTASSSSITSQQRPPLQPSTAVSTTLIAPTKSTMVASEEIQVPYARDSLPASSARLSRAEDEDGYGIRSEDVLRREYELKIAQLSARVASVEETAANAREGETRERESREAAERDVGLVKEQLVTFSEKLRGLEVELEETRTAHAREKERARASEAQVRELELNPTSSSKAPAASEEDLQSVKTQIKDLMRELNGLSVLNDELHAERESEREKVRLAEDRAKEMETKWRAAKLELRNLKATSQMFVSARRTEDHLPATRNGALADVHVQTFQTSIDGVITAARSTTPSSVLAAMKHVIVAVQSISSDVELFEARPPAERLDIDMNTLRSLKDRSTTNLTTFAHAAKEFATSYGLSPISLLDAAASELAANIVGLTKLLGIRRTTGSSSSAEGNDSAKSATNGGMNLTTSISSASSSAASTDRGGTSSTAPSSVSRNPSSASSFQSDAYDARSSQYTARPSHRDSQDQHQQQQQEQQQRARLRSDASRRGTSTSSIGSAFDLERKPSTTATDTSSRGHGGGGRWDGGAGGNMFNDKLERDGAAEELRVGEGDENESEEGGEGDRAWNELKPYLDTQSDSLISSISTLLSSVRSNEPSPVVRDNLSSVIVLGSSIVGVSKDSLPAHSLGEGRRLLRELAANCDLLSELSEGSELGVPERNRITGPTFELARNLKSLMSI